MYIKANKEGREATIELPDESKIETVMNEIFLLLLVLGFNTDDIKRVIKQKALELSDSTKIVVVKKEGEIDETKK